MPDAVIVLDIQHRIVDLNRAAERVVRTSAADIVGAPAERVFSARPDLVQARADQLDLQAELQLGDTWMGSRA
ncbi:MAG TPA: PAS domain-containing protein [Chloroflexota bacterium]|jgi:PAS domain-containing protein